MASSSRRRLFLRRTCFRFRNCAGPRFAVGLKSCDNEHLEGRFYVAGKCDVCGKHRMFGNNVSFSKRHTNRDFKPNVHKKRLILNGEPVRLNICTRCLRTQGKAGKAA
jgi:large subunit ribosomal protein L28